MSRVSDWLWDTGASLLNRAPRWIRIPILVVLYAVAYVWIAAAVVGFVWIFLVMAGLDWPS